MFNDSQIAAEIFHFELKSCVLLPKRSQEVPIQNDKSALEKFLQTLWNKICIPYVHKKAILFIYYVIFMLKK